MPHKYVVSLTDLIIKYVGQGKIEYFADFNLKMLMENRIQILVLKKRTNEYFKKAGILIEIFRRLLNKADNIVRIKDKSNPKNIINVSDFTKAIKNSKSFNLSKNSSSGIKENYSILLYYSLLIISTRVPVIKEINIINIDLSSIKIILPELLLEFKALEKLKLKIKFASCLKLKKFFNKIISILKIFRS